MNSIELPLKIESLRPARDFIRNQLEKWGLGDRWQVILVASELAANAVQHAQTPFSVSVGLAPNQQVRVEVRDGAAAQQVAADLSERGGLGLRIIEKLATDWGVDRDEAGKTVWVLLPLPQQE